MKAPENKKMVDRKICSFSLFTILAKSQASPEVWPRCDREKETDQESIHFLVPAARQSFPAQKM